MISVAEMARDGLEFTPELAAATSEIYDRVKDVIFLRRLSFFGLPVTLIYALFEYK